MSKIEWANGDIVYNNKPDSKAFRLSGVANNVAPNGMHVKWSNGKEFFYTNREIIAYLLRERCKPKADVITKWTFNVLSSAAIDEQEIKDSLTRANPIAIVQISTGITLVMLHQYLLEKADVIDIATPETGYDSIYVLQTTQVSEWINWAKAVKKASWGEERIAAKVTVSLPTI